MEFKIDRRMVGANHPTYIIAELSANHKGCIQNAFQLIKDAKEAGADAVKLQSYTAETITINSKRSDFLIPSSSPWSKEKTLFDLYKRAQTPYEWHKRLFSFAKENNITIFSSPFDNQSLQLLMDLQAPAYKIASPEITDVNLISKVAQTNKPVFLSTGLADLKDIELAVKTLVSNNCRKFSLLKCTSSYPAPFEDINLLTMVDLANRFKCLTGVSDHTLGSIVPISSVSLGGRVIEKHLKLEDDDKSVDSFFSLSKTSFREMVESVRKTETVLGSIDYNLSKSASKNFFCRRSLYYTNDVSKGEKLTSQNIASVRPHYGLHPSHYNDMIGSHVNRHIKKGERASMDDII